MIAISIPTMTTRTSTIRITTIPVFAKITLLLLLFVFKKPME